jgi:hypothetical protein
VSIPPESDFSSLADFERVPQSQPPTSWWWQWLDPAGEVIDPEDGRQEFPTRGDAESWLGEAWAELAEQGVASVSLHEGDRHVYGPMSLSA